MGIEHNGKDALTVTYYETLQNSDMIEGRGPMKVVGTWQDLISAVDDAKGRAPYGNGDGEVQEIVLTFLREDQRVSVRKMTVYGYRRGNDGVSRYGYIDLRDEPDPRTNAEYAQYLKLKEKYDGR